MFHILDHFYCSATKSNGHDCREPDRNPMWTLSAVERKIIRNKRCGQGAADNRCGDSAGDNSATGPGYR